MVVAGRRRSIGLSIRAGVGLIVGHPDAVIGLGYCSIGKPILLFSGACGLDGLPRVVLNTTLVREVRRNEQKDAFYQRGSAELKTPGASTQLYLETLQTRSVGRRQSGRSVLGHVG